MTKISFHFTMQFNYWTIFNLVFKTWKRWRLEMDCQVKCIVKWNENVITYRDEITTRLWSLKTPSEYWSRTKSPRKPLKSKYLPPHEAGTTILVKTWFNINVSMSSGSVLFLWPWNKAEPKPLSSLHLSINHETKLGFTNRSEEFNAGNILL